ncbi:sulfurtransferase TusA family protein [Bacillus sp. AG4(2022)]|uniref:sulfurtransferase TusA family protein n=1 Tax=Bacillus sp. AG4(2022) TaxID=2962594 RepID=UPI00288287C7|nr:sulfurtransferase TusA family protein [Bacillus sp. AG4(2022)]MDT0162274.1 sulfurtransferase TusA family protein [Bacillus sp. AG4(2022)]
MTQIKTDSTLDAKGLACPMPIVKTKKMITGMNAGEVLEVLATDKGSKADLKAWAESAGHQYLGTVEEEGVLKHYLRKASGEEVQEKKHPHVVSNEDLEKLVGEDGDIIVLDVRESAEFAFHHIPGAVSIPLGELEERAGELDGEAPVYVVCRTGSRSDLAARMLDTKGFKDVKNVIPGMSQWNGPSASMNQ